MFRSLIIILLSLFISGGFAQQTIPLKKKNVGASTQAFLGTDGDTCLRKEFSVVFYWIQDTGMFRTPADAKDFTDSIIRAFNLAFDPICVKFKKCGIEMIPHHNFNEWKSAMTDQAAMKSWYTDKVINIYLPMEIKQGIQLDIKSFAHAKGVWGAAQSTLDAVVLQTDTPIYTPALPVALYADAIHAMGHFMGLPDTFAELGPPATPPPPAQAIISEEFADGTNSSVNGDLFTDTEADPYPHEWWEPPWPKPVYCNFAMGTVDGKGYDYTPPVDNYMSLWDCRCRFTQEQYNYMARYILKNRMYLH